jgi:exodeoxyribonuclease V alpha subunit
VEGREQTTGGWTGVVERITYRNPENGWTILKVAPAHDPQTSVPVVVSVERIYPGATCDFFGEWTVHASYGRQFKASRVVERAATNAAALERYLGSGMIKGIGPKTAQRIVAAFGAQTLEVFDNDSDKLLQVPGISRKKLSRILESWGSQRSAREAVVFLQAHGIGAALAGRIIKAYGDRTVAVVRANPYRLSYEIYGIGFATADQIAREIGVESDSEIRIRAGVRQVLFESRNEGHCYLTEAQVLRGVAQLIGPVGDQKILQALNYLLTANEICAREIVFDDQSQPVTGYYDAQIFVQESNVAARIATLLKQQITVDRQRMRDILDGNKSGIVKLSAEQRAAVEGIAASSFSLLTGGPGCGKTTTMETLVRLMQAMNKQVLLAAPTGRAAQRMSEVIGVEAKTIHRMLEWNPQFGGFRRGKQEPLAADFVVVDETSMMDMGLASALLDGIPDGCQVLLVGDPDQLPSVGAGNVLADLLASPLVHQFRLTQVFRQAQESSIVRHAHAMNHGECPVIASPVGEASVWERREDCLFLDADEPTAEELEFIDKAGRAMDGLRAGQVPGVTVLDSQGRNVTNLVKEVPASGSVDMPANAKPAANTILRLPPTLRGGNFAKLASGLNTGEALRLMDRDSHPWSTLQYGMTGVDTVRHLYLKTIPEKLGADVEIQVISPQVRGSLGTANLNTMLQLAANPPAPHKDEVKIGDRSFRVGDRVMQTRNNYELAVFNGDIGRITTIDTEEDEVHVTFGNAFDERFVIYDRTNVNELTLAYAITIHKSQGSEFPVVIIPVVSQHFTMLYRNLIYTGLTRARKLAILVGDRKALQIAVRRQDNRLRQSALRQVLEEGLARIHG